MYPRTPPRTGFCSWTSGLALLALLSTTGCGDEARPTQTLVPEAPSENHLGSGFHWDVRTGSPKTINEAIWQYPVPFNVGTGRISPFLRVQADPEEDGFNTDGTLNYDQKAGQWTHSLLLSDIPTIVVNGVRRKEIIFDANESNSDLLAAQFAINEFDIYECTGVAAKTFSTRAQLAACAKIYQINDGGPNSGRAMATDAATSGSGNALDYRILVPEAPFTEENCTYQPGGGSACDKYIILDVDMGDASDVNWKTSSTFEEFSIIRRPQVRVSKTAVVNFTRTYNWKVTKVADDELHQLLPGGTGTTNYTITAELDTPPYVDSNHQVSGVITIANLSGQTARITNIVDILPDASTLQLASLSCSQAGTPVNSLPYDLQTGRTITCNYSSAFAGGTINKAVVSIADPEDLTTQLPDAEGQATLAVGTMTEVNKVVDVYDEYFGSDDPDAAPVLLGQASVDDPPPTSFNRQRSWTFNFPSTTSCGVFDNTGAIYVTGANPSSASPLDTDDARVTVTCAHLTVTKTAATSLTRTWSWTIDKSVTPAVWNLFRGDDGTSEYTVAVDKVGSTDSDWAVSGSIAVLNDGPFAVMLSSVTDVVSGPIPATVDCGVSFPYNLAIGATLNCTYSSPLPNGNERTNTATANLQGGGSFSSSAVPVSFAAPTVTQVNATINVTDTYAGALGSASDDSSWKYSRTFACDANQGTHDNTATITETGQSDDASVTVNCYAPTVSKDASTSLTRTWTWTIEKDLDTSVFLAETFDEELGEATIQETETLLVEWDVTLNATPADDNWAVAGNITINNPHPSRAASLTQVLDAMGPIQAVVVCPSLSVPAGGSLVCSYSADLPDATSRLNSASATLQNQSFDKNGVGSNSGTTNFGPGTASVSFAAPTITEVDECVDISDILEQAGVEVGSKDLGTYCANQPLPKVFDVQFEFGGEIGIDLVCGENHFDNTASFVTNDTGTTGDAESDVSIVVVCEVGCTLTQGYWKTHNATFPGGASKNADATWLQILPSAELSPFYLSGQTWYQVFWTAPKGNVYYILAHQYMAAKLNTLAGVTPSANVQAAITYAETFFSTYTPAQAAAFKGNNPTKAAATAAAGLLGRFNEGLEGVEHCTENTEQSVT